MGVAFPAGSEVVAEVVGLSRRSCRRGGGLVLG